MARWIGLFWHFCSKFFIMIDQKDLSETTFLRRPLFYWNGAYMSGESSPNHWRSEDYRQTWSCFSLSWLTSPWSQPNAKRLDDVLSLFCVLTFFLHRACPVETITIHCLASLFFVCLNPLVFSLVHIPGGWVVRAPEESVAKCESNCFTSQKNGKTPAIPVAQVKRREKDMFISAHRRIRTSSWSVSDASLFFREFQWSRFEAICRYQIPSSPTKCDRGARRFWLSLFKVEWASSTNGRGKGNRVKSLVVSIAEDGDLKLVVPVRLNQI